MAEDALMNADGRESRRKRQHWKANGVNLFVWVLVFLVVVLVGVLMYFLGNPRFGIRGE